MLFLSVPNRELPDISLYYIVIIQKEIVNSVNGNYLDFGIKFFFFNFANIFREYNLIPKNYINKFPLLYNYSASIYKF